MLLEIRTVSRKTPLDGKLEITPATFARLSMLGADLSIVVGERELAADSVAGQLESMGCTCDKGAGDRHVHHFLQGSALRQLDADSSVRLVLDEAAAIVRIVPESPPES